MTQEEKIIKDSIKVIEKENNYLIDKSLKQRATIEKQRKEVDTLERANESLSKQCKKTLLKQEDLKEMIEGLIDELEGTTKTEHTFRLIREAKDLIYY